MKIRLIAILMLWCFSTPALLYAQFYNGSQTEFGKNRVQYQDFKWNFIKFDKYEVYYNTGGKELAIYTAKAAKVQIAEVERFFDYSLNERIQFIVYNKQEDFKQSNVGLSTDDGSNVGGMTRIVGKKVFLYFEGDHVRFEEQIRSGIAEVIVNQMMYGGNVRDMAKNSTLLALPEWYIKGLVSYVGKGWNTDVDNRVRDGITAGRFRKFNHLTGDDAAIAGHSIWYFIAEKYSPAVIPNILYMTKVSRNVESSFLFVLGVNMRNLTFDWQNYYSKKFAFNDTTRTLPRGKEMVRKVKSNRAYNQAKVSPDGKYMTYVTNEMGQVKLWLLDLATGKKKRLFKKGQKLDRVNDFSYPLVAWHPSGQLLSWFYEKEGETFLVIYTIEDGSKIVKPVYNFIKIIDYSYSPDGKFFVMSAVQKGQTDIFVYAISGGSTTQITNDIWDDLNPSFIDGGKNIVFSSNRDNDTIKTIEPNQKLIKSFDLFVYNWASKSNVLRRITNTPHVNELQCQPYDDIRFAYLSDQNGIKNRYVGYFDSAIAYVDTVEHYRYFVRSMAITNYKFGILEQHIAPGANKLAEVVYHDGRYHIYTEDLQPHSSLSGKKLIHTPYRDRVIELTKIEAELDSIDRTKKTTSPSGKPMQTVKVYENPAQRDQAKKDSAKIDIGNYQFEGTTPRTYEANVPPPPTKTASPDTLTDSTRTGPARDVFVLPIIRNYKVQFTTEYFQSQLDNSFLNAGYQRFSGGGAPIYLNPGFTGLFKIGLTDLLEDHKVTGGVRLSADLKSNEYVLLFEDRLRRWDKFIMLHRQGFLNVSSGGGTLSRIYTHEGRYGLRYPFNEVLAVRMYAGYRNDRRTFLATDFLNLNRNSIHYNSANAKVELIYDNTIKRGLNLYNGLRFKVFFETFQGLDSLVRAENKDNRKLKNDLYVAGFDLRYYQKVHREIVWATRFSAATSFGNDKLVYYMGGVDNWLIPRFDQSVNIATDKGYAYQTIVTPMRGFYQNIRNGNSYAIINSELRVPIFRYLFNRPLRSDFINNFQVVGFGDIGTAWTGTNPYDPDNSLNTTVVSSTGNPITVVLTTHKEPIVGGYGFGLRSRIWGYFVRVDWAWGVEDRVVLPRTTYLSFSLDF